MPVTKILFILSTMDIGGVQSGIMNFAKLLPKDVCQIDVLVLTDKIGFHEKEFLSYGNLYHMPILRQRIKLLEPITMLLNNCRLKRKLSAFLKTHQYDVVHSKSLTYSAVIVEASKRAGILIRVAQSHVDRPDHLNIFHNWYYKWCADRIEKSATCKLAVSPKAADLMFGKYGGRVIKNPTISLVRFNPSKYEYKPNKDIIQLIHIGTFSHRKNQVFSIKVLEELIRHGNNAVITFIGYTFDDPDYINEMKLYAEEHNVNTFIHYLPKDSDIPYQLSQSDYMLLPSLREGLPNVALESQAMGVPCFISDSVNRDTDCGLCVFLSLDDGPNKWADCILRFRKEHGIEKNYIDMSDWDNTNVVKEYLKIWNVEGYSDS